MPVDQIAKLQECPEALADVRFSGFVLSGSSLPISGFSFPVLIFPCVIDGSFVGDVGSCHLQLCGTC